MTSPPAPMDPLDVAATAFSSTAQQLAAELGVIRSTLGVNLRALEAAGVVLADDPSTDRSGRRLRYRLNLAVYEGAVAAIRRLIA